MKPLLPILAACGPEGFHQAPNQIRLYHKQRWCIDYCIPTLALCRLRLPEREGWSHQSEAIKAATRQQGVWWVEVLEVDDGVRSRCVFTYNGEVIARLGPGAGSERRSI